MSEWLRRDKWVGFYQGSYAPHLPADARENSDAAGQLPWRSHQPASQLRDFLATEDVKGRALELGCGTGENLVALARHGFDFVCGVDIVKEAVEISTAAMQMQPSTNWQVICADILELPTEDIALLDGGSWQYDFIFDCQCFHCLYQMDPEAAAQAIAHLLAPGGELLMLTGNSEEPASRGPVQLSKDEVLHAFDATELRCQDLRSAHFDWTETYRRQDFSDPPLAWCSRWIKPT